MKYFQYFPSLTYDFDGIQRPVTNLTANVKMVERLKQHVTVLYDYIVEDGDRPDTVSDKLYGSVNYTWIILLANNIHSLYDWPLTSEEFDRYIIDKYGALSTAHSSVYYRTTDGDLIDQTSYETWLSEDRRGGTISYYDYELARNEAKRRIKVVPQAFAEALTMELRQLMQS